MIFYKRFVVHLMTVCILILQASCKARGTDSGHDTDYVFVYLKSGPTSGTGDKEARKKMFEGHMGNIKALADEGKLVVAGPFNKPSDKAWRGILVLDTKSMRDAEEWCGRDPGVMAGEFVAEKHAMRGSHVLRRTMEFERAMEAEAKNAEAAGAAKPTNGMPPNIRGYVMVTAEDFDRARGAIEASAWKDKVVWSGRFVNAGGIERGVIVLDETETEPVSRMLIEKGEEQGGCAVDGWWSTGALMKLPRE